MDDSFFVIPTANRDRLPRIPARPFMYFLFTVSRDECYLTFNKILHYDYKSQDL